MDKGVYEYFKGKRRLVTAVLLLLAGFLLVLFPLSDKEEETKTNTTLEEYRVQLEEEVASLASGVKGVGKCRVFITFERGAQNTYKGGDLIETKPPLVLGVTVVCDGADSDHVRSRLTDMITALFDIASNRVAILKSK